MQLKLGIHVGKTIMHKPHVPIYYKSKFTCDCVESLHYLARFVVCVATVIKTLLHDFDSFITFYLICLCATFLGDRTPRNAMKCSIEICLL